MKNLQPVPARKLLKDLQQQFPELCYYLDGDCNIFTENFERILQDKKHQGKIYTWGELKELIYGLGFEVDEIKGEHTYAYADGVEKITERTERAVDLKEHAEKIMESDDFNESLLHFYFEETGTAYSGGD